MLQTIANVPEIKRRIAALRDFARAVGLNLKSESQDDGTLDLCLYDAKGEPLCREFDCADMAESIGVYAGSHADFKDAQQDYELYA